MHVERLIPSPADIDRIEDIFEAAIRLDRQALRNTLDGEEKYYIIRAEDGTIAGVYILREEPLPFFLSLKPSGAKYRGRGVQGILLALDPVYKGQGWGRMLIEHPRTLGYDYIWGQAMASLNNLSYWKRRREHLSTEHGVHITAQLLG
jgi:GNAT superfamily N-acetyltransferase